MEKSKENILRVALALLIVVVGISCFFIGKRLNKKTENNISEAFYYVNFETKTDELIFPKIVGKGKKAESPQAPVKMGYSFDGWYINEDFSTQAWNFETNAVNENIALFAKWSKRELDIVYDYGDAVTIKASAGANSNIVAPLENPSREDGKVFAGWYRDADFIESWNFSNDSITQDIALYARWLDVTDASFFEVLEREGGYGIKIRNEKMKEVPKTIVVPALYEGLPVVSTLPYFCGQDMDQTQALRIEAVVLPPSIKTIEENSFHYASRMKSINLENIETMGPSTFSYCAMLENIDLGSLKTMTYGFLDGCVKIKELNFPQIEEMDYFYASQIKNLEVFRAAKLKRISAIQFDYTNKIREIILPELEEVTNNIGFYGLSALTTLSLPKVKTLASSYINCPSLTNIQFDSLEEIGDSTFSGCISLKEITFPSLKKIGQQAFFGCTSLEKININFDNVEVTGNPFTETSWYYNLPENEVVYLGKTVIGFTIFNNITDLTLKEEARIITNYAFSGAALRSANLGRIQKIGEGAFYNCDSLETVEMLDGIEIIGDSAFRYCNQLLKITIKAPVPPTIAKYSFPETTIFYVPDESLDAYKLAWATIIAEARIKGISELVVEEAA